ncbi:riboflavin kinase [Gregarina niphandrodes]|uniref:riboflavin kinase n=1 Tax=Gregarina niphandrodes TaxID=110365 RepID=A0A023BD33_GRENI|nr:riboflavin kinase [Gregarina niphandrodes]EZG86783.1 riboflavin kinase [Gregarina niphandrodes]|eukprot:XP_011128739.1 riboflavin kinase [Gregarina niphandrodes]
MDRALFRKIIKTWDQTWLEDEFEVCDINQLHQASLEASRIIVRTLPAGSSIQIGGGRAVNLLHVDQVVACCQEIPVQCKTMDRVLTSCPLTKQAWRNGQLRLPEKIRIEGVVIHGFKRGSTQLGCPTANVGTPTTGENITIPFNKLVTPGTYFGTCIIDSPAKIPKAENRKADERKGEEVDDGIVGTYMCVISVGYSPYYDNAEATIEVHVFHNFPKDFYGFAIAVNITSFLRPESNFESLRDLIFAIQMDCETALE